MRRTDILQRLVRGELTVEDAEKELDKVVNLAEALRKSVEQIRVEVRVYHISQLAKMSEWDERFGDDPNNQPMFMHFSEELGPSVASECGKVYVDRQGIESGAIIVADGGIRIGAGMIDKPSLPSLRVPSILGWKSYPVMVSVAATLLPVKPDMSRWEKPDIR
jgi:hypothetical protein